MERKSPARRGRSGPSAMCACEIFSTMVWPMCLSVSRAEAHTSKSEQSTARLKTRPFKADFEQLHQLGHARLLLQVPDGIHCAAACFARHHRLGERLKLFFNFLVSQRISRVALRIVELLGEFTSVDGVNPHDDALQRRKHLLDLGIGND